MQDKQNKVLGLFFNKPKHWHFNELLEDAQISRPQLAQWLKVFEKENLIKRVKPRGKMPYYVGNIEYPTFRNRKSLFAKEILFKSGLLDHLVTLAAAKVIVIFGSFSRWDWYDGSDIDIFMYGKDNHFEQGKYELKIKREIQLHHAENLKDLKRMEQLLPAIISGDFIKGSLRDLGVEIHAKT